MISASAVTPSVSDDSLSPGKGVVPTIKSVGRQIRASSAAASAVMPRAPPEISTGSPGFSSSAEAARLERAFDRLQADPTALVVTHLGPAIADEQLGSQTVGDGLERVGRREIDHARPHRGPFSGQCLDQPGDPAVAGEEIGVRATRAGKSAPHGRRRDQASASLSRGGFQIGGHRLGQQEQPLHFDADAGGPAGLDALERGRVCQRAAHGRCPPRDRAIAARSTTASTAAGERPVDGLVRAADSLDRDAGRHELRLPAGGPRHGRRR